MRIRLTVGAARFESMLTQGLWSFVGYFLEAQRDKIGRELFEKLRFAPSVDVSSI